MTAPHTPPAALDVAAIGDLMGADEARSLLAAMTPGTLEVAEIRDGRLIDAAPQELAVVIHDDARAHQKPDGTWHSVVVCRGMDGPTRDANADAFAAVKRALATVAALRAQPVPALDVAAIEARATVQITDDAHSRVPTFEREYQRVLDDALRGAPSGYVPARLVREYLDAVDEWDEGEPTDAWTAARTALNAALAAATTTPTEGHGR